MRSKKSEKRIPGQNQIVAFFMPNKWKIIITVLLYFSNYISFLGLIINYPIFYIYWNYTLSVIDKTVIFVFHIAYLYFISAIIVKLIV